MHAYTGGYPRVPIDCHFLPVKYVCIRPDYGGLQVQMLFTTRVRNSHAQWRKASPAAVIGPLATIDH